LAFLDLYSKVDAEVESPANTSNLATATAMLNEEIPF
jgi:hypothetical protein